MKQSLYLSSDADRMCEVVQNSRAQIWHHSGVQKKGGLITWTLLYRIKKNFPFLATQLSSLPYFLSDDFSTMVDFDNSKKRLRLLCTETGNVIGHIPTEAQ